MNSGTVLSGRRQLQGRPPQESAVPPGAVYTGCGLMSGKGWDLTAPWMGHSEILSVYCSRSQPVGREPLGWESHIRYLHYDS